MGTRNCSCRTRGHNRLAGSPAELTARRVLVPSGAAREAGAGVESQGRQEESLDVVRAAVRALEVLALLSHLRFPLWSGTLPDRTSDVSDIRSVSTSADGPLRVSEWSI